MALKWLNRIFHKKDDDRPERTKSLALSEIDRWLEERARGSEFEETVQKLYGEIEDATEDLAHHLRKLDSASPLENVHPRLLKAGLASREAVGKQMGIFIDKLEPPKRVDFDSATEYHTNVIKHLENTVQKFGRAQKYTAAVFSEEWEIMATDLNRLTRLLTDLGGAVEEKDNKLKVFVEAMNLSTRIKNEREEVAAIREEIAEDEDRLARLRETAERLDEELDREAASEVGQRRSALRDTLEEKRRALSHVEADMVDLVAPMKKALNRLVKQDSSERLSLQHRDALELISTSPSQALEMDISRPLLEMKANLDELGLRNKKRANVLDQIDHLLEDKPLESLKIAHSKLQEEIEALEGRIDEESREAVRLKEEIARARKAIDRAEEELDDKRRLLDVVDGRRSEAEEWLKRKIEKIVGGPVDIDMNA